MPRNSAENDDEKLGEIAGASAKIRFGLSRFYAPTLAFLCFALVWRTLNADDDFWAHAAIGRWIWNHKSAPHESLFLWGSAPISWVAHSWLTQLCFYFFLQIGGVFTARGDIAPSEFSLGNGPFVAMFFTVIIVGAVFANLWHLWKRFARPNGAALLLFALTFYAGSLRYRTRPELFSALFLTILLCVLIRRDDDFEYSKPVSQSRLSRTCFAAKSSTRLSETRGAIGLILLFALWANFHGAVVIGVVILWLTAICDFLQLRFGARPRNSGARCWRFFALTLACTLATGLVPFHAFEYWKSVLDSTHGATFARIIEWQPPVSGKEISVFLRGGLAPELMPFMLAEIGLFVCALLAWTANPKRRFSQIAWMVFMGAMLLRQRRHLWLFALICLAVIAANAAFFATETLWKRWNSRTILRRKTREDRVLDAPENEVFAFDDSKKEVSVEKNGTHESLENSHSPQDSALLEILANANSANATSVDEFSPTEIPKSPQFARDSIGYKTASHANSANLVSTNETSSGEILDSDASANAELANEIPKKTRFCWQLAAIICVFLASFSALPRDVFTVRVASSRLPDAACRVLEMRAKERNRPFRLLCEYENSSYLQWRLNREDARGVVPNRGVQPLYIDLLNAYPDWLLLQYIDIFEAKKKGQIALEKRGVDCVILAPNPKPGKLAKFLDASASWNHVYRGRDADIWIRRDFASGTAKS